MKRRASSPALPPQARALVLLAAGTCLLPLLLQLPDWLGPAFAALALLVGAASWKRPLPGPLRVLVAIGVVVAVFSVLPYVGRDTACAVLAGMLALKPSETVSLRDARSLLGFALFAPFATFLLDQGPLSLLLAAIGAICVLLVLHRLASFQGGMERAPFAQGLPRVLWMVGLGLPLALAAFWLFPRLPTPLWGLPERAVATPGLSDEMKPGGWLDLMNDDTPAARVVFHGAVPEPQQMYWRGPVLWQFDGMTWRAAPWLQRRPPPPVPDSGTNWRYRIELEPTERRQLVALDVPTSTPQGVWATTDFGMFVPQPLSNVSRWEMQSTAAQVVEAQLPDATRRLALALPPGHNPRTVALGRRWRAEAGGDDRVIIERALSMIRAQFAYTLSTPLDGRNGVDTFLFDRKTGYCEHFSSAFTVLMRAAGIPARVVTGYAGGYRNPIGDYWLIRRSDAHAWTEVWLPQRGWVRVDPTAAVAPERVYDTLADRASGTFGNFAMLAPAFDASDWLRRGWNNMVLGFNAERQAALLRPLGLGQAGAATLISLLVLCTVVALAWMAWLLARGERERDPLLRAWHRLGRRYARRGLARERHEPAEAWAQRVGADQPGAGDSLLVLSRRFQAQRYGPHPDKDAQRGLLRALAAHRP